MYQDTITYYDSGTTVSTTATMDSTTALVIFISAFVAALLIFFLVARMLKVEDGFLKRVKDYLNFKSIIIDGIIEFLYIFSAIILSVCSIWIMFQTNTIENSVLVGLLDLTLGNVALRVVFEIVMLLVGLWQNTSDIHRILERRYEIAPEKAKEVLHELHKEAREDAKMVAKAIEKSAEKPAAKPKS